MSDGSSPPAGQIPSDARRVSVSFDRLRGWVDGVAARHGPVVWTAGSNGSSQPADGDPTPIGGERLDGLAADGTRVWIEVPYPPLPAAGAPIEALLAHVTRPRRIGLILVRRGGYGVGVFDGSTLIASKVGSSYVQGTTKAGGWSQQRFARRRENQARSAFATAADEAARVVLPEARKLDAVVCGGDRPAVDAVLADPRLASLRAKRGGPWLAVPDPRRAVVEAAPRTFLAVTIRIHP